MGGPSPEKGPGNRRQHQVDTTQNRRKTILYQMLPDSLFAVNRTVETSSERLLKRTPPNSRLCLLLTSNPSLIKERIVRRRCCPSTTSRIDVFVDTLIF